MKRSASECDSSLTRNHNIPVNGDVCIYCGIRRSVLALQLADEAHVIRVRCKLCVMVIAEAPTITLKGLTQIKTEHARGKHEGRLSSDAIIVRSV